MRRFYHIALLLLGSSAVSSCGKDAIIGVEVPNTPPETQVTSTPPTLSETGYSVRFFWSASDPDGAVEGFLWRISDNGSDGMVDVADTLGLAWNYTEVTDSTFVVNADMSEFPPDVAIGGLTPKSWRFWQTHTFFLRAVDDRGAVDPTPASVSFTATTIAPFVSRTLPVGDAGPSCTSGPLALAFGWEAVDPDNPEGEPEFIRYKLIPVFGNDGACYTRSQFAASTIVQDSENIPWSRWIRYDAPLDSGKIVRFSPQGVSNNDRFIFLAQARDVAGAITPTFEWGQNVWHIRATANKFPELEVSERYLGGATFRSIGGGKAFAIVSRQPLEFTWSASAASYGGLIEGYKYGFDVADPNDPNDEGWFVDWGIGTNWQRSLPRTFSQGSPNFVVQVRDNSGSISRAVYQFQVIQIAQRSEQETLLFVDDALTDIVGRDAIEDAGWASFLAGIRGFQFANHSIDAKTETPRLTFALANEYKAVIWYTSASSQTYLAQQLAPRSSSDVQFNWLEIYQRFVGNVLMVGPSAMIRTIERLQFAYPVIFNSSAPANEGLAYSMGTRRLPDGTVVNRGTERFPYTAWCLEAVDLVRPSGIAPIVGERAGLQLRNSACDGLAFARVAPDFIESRQLIPSQVANLLPTEPRLARPVGNEPGQAETNALQLDFEEFYNRNVTTRATALNLRPCQEPMFLHIARSDIDEVAVMDPSQADPKGIATTADSLFYSRPENAGYRLAAQPRRVSFTNDPLDFDPSDGIDRVKDCGWAKVQRRQTSQLTGAPVAIASSAFAQAGTKQDGQVTTSDFVFGFNPFGFQTVQMGQAISWILDTYWGLNSQN